MNHPDAVRFLRTASKPQASPKAAPAMSQMAKITRDRVDDAGGAGKERAPYRGGRRTARLPVPCVQP